ncbi:hypothetical protein AB0G74_21670 [Streptomyces sp. NPDC020875]|uniref:hypothetical protein n=1 Tax=Streptomyces sp. NPDC020875 TaxID=3154898 RepID=UPI0033F9DCFE
MTGDGVGAGVVLWAAVLAGLAAVTVVARAEADTERPELTASDEAPEYEEEST